MGDARREEAAGQMLKGKRGKSFQSGDSSLMDISIGHDVFDMDQ